MTASEFRKGKKTFIINADSALVLEEHHLQMFFLGGYEVYPLEHSPLIPIEDQVDCLAELFEDLIVFFNVDEQPKNSTWPEVIRQVSHRHQSRVRLGVFHHEQNPTKKKLLEETYLMNLQIQAGCVYVPRSRFPDIAKLQKTLVANEANGRRKAIRMVCTGRMNFHFGGHRYEAKILDISISHFTCVFKSTEPDLPVSTRVEDIQMMVGGPVFHVAAYLLMKRQSGAGETLYVFGFSADRSGEIGLDNQTRLLLIRLIQRSCSDSVLELVLSAFQNRRKHHLGGAAEGRAPLPVLSPGGAPQDSAESAP